MIVRRSECEALTLSLLRGDAGDGIVLEQALRALVCVDLHVSLGTEGRVCRNRNAENLAELDEGLLGEVGVDFDLEHLRLDTRIAEDIVDKRALSIAKE